jgi:hypothetical protein
MNMPLKSGTVDLKAEDIVTALEALSEEQSLVASMSGRGATQAEIDFHEAYLSWIASWLRQFSDMAPGAVFFSEHDLLRLRGIFFNAFKARLARCYRNAVLSDDSVFVPMLRRLQQIEDFEARMLEPTPFSGEVIGFDGGFPSAPVSRFV